ncbi:M56 family metallopeptidase [Acholeplasma sp. OttesenSCG-928-E16]|nr:M56 family metallopeptidase [Acholeplasma sp. OttesenSCG-928-E16]
MEKPRALDTLLIMFSLFFVFGIIALGYIFVKDIDYLFIKIIFIISFLASFTLLVIGFVNKAKYKRIRPDLRKMREELEINKKRMEEDLYQVKKEIEKKIRYVYIYSTIFLFILLIAAIGALYFHTALIIVTFFLGGYIFIVLSRMIVPVRLQKPIGLEYSFPLVEAIVDEIKKEFQIEKKVKVIINDGAEVLIFKYGKIYVIDISYFLLCTFSKRELKAVLLHEFAHLINQDVDGLNKAQKRIGKINYTFDVLLAMGFYVPFVIDINTKSMHFDILASLSREKMADEFVIKNEYSNDAASALYKSELIKRAINDVKNIDITIDFVDDYYDEMTKLLLKIIEENEKKYQYFLQSEVPMKYNTHLVFKDRLEFLDVKEYSKEIGLSRVFNKDLETAKKSLLRMSPYLSSRVRENVKIIKKINEENPSLLEKENPTLEETLKLLSNLSYISDYETSEKVLSSVYQKYQDDPDINFYYAILYFDHYNDQRGISYMYRALENPKNFEYGTKVLSDFLLSNGLEEELEKFRNRQADLLESSYEDNSDIDFLLRGAKKVESFEPFYAIANQLMQDHDSLKEIIIFKKEIKKRGSERFYLLAGVDYSEYVDYSSLEREVYLTIGDTAKFKTAINFYDIKNLELSKLYKKYLIKKG